jgi:uncharacterized protein (UPF0261 family)
MTKTIAIIGTLDTKGEEFHFLKTVIEAQGLKTLVIDAGVHGEPYFQPDVKAEAVADLGGEALESLRKKNDRGRAIDVMMRGATRCLQELQEEDRVHGVISLGGTAGTTIGTSAMRAMPVGFPKLMVSTVASGDTRPYVDVKDITMMYSVVDISGINSLSAKILSNAAKAIAGMVGYTYALELEKKPLIGATMFGVTTPCVTTARTYLEEQGYEVLVFHATGTGGRAMESLIADGFISGVLDITTTEWCDELVGGVLSAGPHRLEAAGKRGIPQVVSVGALDMVNFGPYDTVPGAFAGRKLYKHNATVTLMRTTPSENEALGKIIAEKLNAAQGPTALYLPLKGVSMIDVEGQPFHDPEADRVLFDTLRTHVKAPVELHELETPINEDTFALAMAKRLVSMMEESKQ